MQNLQVGLGAVLALDTSAFLARQPPPRQPETTRHDGITPSNTPPSIRHPTHRLLWDAPENRASGPPSTALASAVESSEGRMRAHRKICIENCRARRSSVLSPSPSRPATRGIDASCRTALVAIVGGAD